MYFYDKNGIILFYNLHLSLNNTVWAFFVCVNKYTSTSFLVTNSPAIYPKYLI